jgi:hypothetical protein
VQNLLDKENKERFRLAGQLTEQDYPRFSRSADSASCGRRNRRHAMRSGTRRRFHGR